MTIRAAKIVSSAMGVVAAGALQVHLAGCSITQPAPIKETFLLSTHEAPPGPAQPKPGTLRVGPFRVAAPFEGKGLVYRTTDINYSSDYYNEFFVAPNVMIGERVAASLAKARTFETIAAPTQLSARYQLVGLVTEMYGDLREGRRPAAVLAIHFYLVHNDDVAQAVLFDREFNERIELSDASPQSIVKGLGTALDGVLAALQRHLLETSLPAESGSRPNR